MSNEVHLPGGGFLRRYSEPSATDWHTGGEIEREVRLTFWDLHLAEGERAVISVYWVGSPFGFVTHDRQEVGCPVFDY